MKLVLHNYWRSSASQRVRIGMNLKRVAFEYVPVNIIQGEQHADGYRAHNAIGQVPTLEVIADDGSRKYITQSLPILEYVEECFPEHPLLPRDPYLRARARGLAELVNSGIQPHQNLTTLARVKEFGGDNIAWVRQFVGDGIAAIARAIGDTAGQFCVGDTPTLADCCVIPQLLSARRFAVDITGYTALLAIEARCLALPAFADAAPDRQPDAVK